MGTAYNEIRGIMPLVRHPVSAIRPRGSPLNSSNQQIFDLSALSVLSVLRNAGEGISPSGPSTIPRSRGACLIRTIDHSISWDVKRLRLLHSPSQSFTNDVVYVPLPSLTRSRNARSGTIYLFDSLPHCTLCPPSVRRRAWERST